MKKKVIANVETDDCRIEVYHCGACETLHTDIAVLLGDGIVSINVEPLKAMNVAVAVMDALKDLLDLIDSPDVDRVKLFVRLRGEAGGGSKPN